MLKIYHVCSLKNVDGTRKLIEFERGERCICASNYLFWKRPQDCETRSVVNRDR